MTIPKLHSLSRLTPLWPLLGLVIVMGIYYLPVIRGQLPIPADALPRMFYPLNTANLNSYQPPKNELVTDVVRQLYPWRQFAIDELKAGRIPWWNPYNFSGTPHLANFQSAVFYPLNLIFWFTSFPIGWTILVISQQVLGALFLYLYLKSLSLKPLACIFGALTWIFSGFFVAWLEWNTLVHTAIWTPLILLAFDKLNRSASLGRWHLILIVSLASQFLAGSPAIWFYLSLFQLTYLLFITRPRLKQLIPLIFDALIFLTLISPQLIPTLIYTTLSNRSVDIGTPLTDPTWFLPYQNLIQLTIPDFFGNPATANYWGIFNYVEFVSFLGFIPFYFALSTLSTKSQHNRLTKFMLLWTLIAFLLATKNPLSALQINLKLPFLSVSNASRWLVIGEISLSVLAALGLDYFHQTKSTRISLWPLIICHLIFFSSLLAILVSSLWLKKIDDQSLTTTLKNLIFPFSLLTMQTLLLLLIKQKVPPRIFPPSLSKIYSKINYQPMGFNLLVAISIIGGLSFATKFTPFSSPIDLYPPSQITNYLHSHGGFFRYLTLDRNILTPNINLPYKLYTIEGYDSLYLNHYGRLITATETNYFPPVSNSFKRLVTTNAYQSSLINLLGVKYILSFDALPQSQFKLVMEEGYTKLYENLQVYPRAFVTISKDVFHLDQIEPAQISSYLPTHVVINTINSQGGFLVLTDAWHPDWKVTIDGSPSSVINFAGLRATIIPRGDHQVIYDYQCCHPQF